MHGCYISLLPNYGTPRFGELLLVILYHMGREFSPFSPILRWTFLPLLYPLGIHAPGLGEFYQCVTDEAWFVECMVLVQVG